MACSQDPVVTIQQASPSACSNMQLQQATMCQDVMGQYMTLDMPTQVLQEQQPGVDLTSAQIQVLLDSMQSSSVNADLSSAPGMVIVDSSNSAVSGALSMPQMAMTMQGTDPSTSMPLVLQFQVPASNQCVQQTFAGPETSLQHMQPVYTTLQGQQVVLVNGPAVNGTLQPQLAACAGTVVSGSNGSAVQVQLQQLQDAVQQLSSQTAAVQQMLLTAQHSQDATNTATGFVQCVTTSAGMPGQTIILLDPSSGQMTTGLVSSSSQETASLCQDNSSGSWQCSDSTSTPMGTPAFTGQQTLHAAGSGISSVSGMTGASAPANTRSPAQGHTTAHILSAPQMPQPASGPMPPQMLMPNGPGHMQQGQGQMQMQMPAGDGTGGCAGQYSNSSGPERGVLMPVHGYSTHGPPHGRPAQQQGYKPHGAYPLKQGGHHMHHMQHMQHHRPGGHMHAAGSLAYRTMRGSSGNGSRPFGHQAARPGRPAGSIQAVAANSMKTAGTGAASAPQGSPAPSKTQAGSADPAGGAAAAPVPARGINSAYSHVPVEEGLGSLWSVEKLQASKGGLLFNVQQLAWLPVGDPEPAAQDLYNFQKLKRVVQKLDAVHKNRVKLIKRIHGVADPGHGDLKDVYREVRSLIGELLHEGSMRLRSLQETGVAGLVRLALLLQDALTLGPKEEGA